MHAQNRSRLISCVLGALTPLFAIAAPPAASSGPEQYVWKPVEIRYSYVGFTTAYNCDAYEQKIRNILRTLGAPEQTQVRASGCTNPNRPERNFFVTITTARPVPPSQAAAEPDQAERELIARLGGKNALPTTPFEAAWKTIDLSQERRLNLQPGDCELMQGLRDEVLPKLSIKVVADSVHCTPKQLSIQTPRLQVSALVPVESPDKAADRTHPGT